MMSAFVFIEVSDMTGAGDVATIHKALHAVPGVKTVHFVAGPTDVIAYVEAADQNGLMECVGKIHAVKGVGHTDTRIVLPS
jgi:copper chaperone CopZ